jgi:hypoxanthine phosphoribosyltransferase
VSADVLRLRWDRAAIAARVAELGAEIGERYRGRRPVLVAVLDGAAVFLADLVRALPLDAEVEVDFLAVRPVDPRARTASQAVGLTKDLETDLAGRDVLVVEDVVNSGLTLQYLLRTLGARDPRSLRVCVLLDRPGERRTTLPVDHAGFAVGPERLIGYGIDLDGRFRDCPDLWEVVDERALRADPDAALAATRTSIEGPGG